MSTISAKISEATSIIENQPLSELSQKVDIIEPKHEDTVVVSGIRDQLPAYKDSPVISMTETKTSSTTMEKNVDFLVTQGNNY